MRRHAHLAFCVTLWLVQPRLTAASDPPRSTQLRQTVSGGVLVNPLGLYARYDAEWILPSGVIMGLFDDFQVFANNVGLRLGWQASPEWLELHVDLAAEPGLYVVKPAGTPVGSIGAIDVTDERSFRVRYSATGQINVNLQLDDWWLYNRTTGVYRRRGFVEEDTFSQMRVDRELSIEQTDALMYRAAGTDSSPALWVYVQYSVGGVLDVGERPNRPSVGLVTDRWLADGLSLNLDVFYSVATDLVGPGGLLVAWYIF